MRSYVSPSRLEFAVYAVMMPLMLSVIIPTLNDEASLPRTLASLVPAAVDGLVREVIVVDGGSTDATLDIVEAAGAKLVRASGQRGAQMAVGAASSKNHWLLFLHPGTALDAGWEDEVDTLFEQIASGRFRSVELAASFRLAINDFSFAARVVEKMVALRCFFLRLPHGDQGLIVHRRLYEKLGGYRDLHRLDDMDFVRRIGRRRLLLLRSHAVVNAEAYLGGGLVARTFRSVVCVVLSYVRVPSRLLAWMYR